MDDTLYLGLFQTFELAFAQILHALGVLWNARSPRFCVCSDALDCLSCFFVTFFIFGVAALPFALFTCFRSRFRHIFGRCYLAPVYWHCTVSLVRGFGCRVVPAQQCWYAGQTTQTTVSRVKGEVLHTKTAAGHKVARTDRWSPHNTQGPTCNHITHPARCFTRPWRGDVASVLGDYVGGGEREVHHRDHKAQADADVGYGT